MRRLFRQFSFPGGIPSHVAPETPGSIHEGGELGYALAHAYGAAFDNPDLRRRAASSATARPRPARWPRAGTRTSSSTRRATARCCRSCTSTATRSPTRRCSPASRDDELRALLRGLRLRAAASSRATTRRRCTSAMAATLDEALDEIARDPGAPRATAATTERPRWPMIVLRTPKGWTGPEGGRRHAGRGHVALAPGAAVASVARQPRAPARSSRRGCAATGPRSCSTTAGAPRAGAARARARRATGGWAPTRTPTAALLLRDLRAARLPRLRRRRADARATTSARRRACSARFLRDVMRRNPAATSASSGPDETASNRLGAVFEVDRPRVDGRDRATATTTSRRTAG